MVVGGCCTGAAAVTTAVLEDGADRLGAMSELAALLVTLGLAASACDGLAAALLALAPAWSPPSSPTRAGKPKSASGRERAACAAANGVAVLESGLAAVDDIAFAPRNRRASCR